MQPGTRSKLRIGHEHRCHGFNIIDIEAPALVFVVAQAYTKPCNWSHAYIIIPGETEPQSKHFSFDPIQLYDYSNVCSQTPVNKIDAEFMLQLACNQARRHIQQALHLPTSRIGAPILFSKTEVALQFLSGDLPQLNRLIEICGEHYLLYRELQDIQNLPLLKILDRI